MMSIQIENEIATYRRPAADRRPHTAGRLAPEPSSSQSAAHINANVQILLVQRHRYVNWCFPPLCQDSTLADRGVHSYQTAKAHMIHNDVVEFNTKAIKHSHSAPSSPSAILSRSAQSLGVSSGYAEAQLRADVDHSRRSGGHRLCTCISTRTKLVNDEHTRYQLERLINCVRAVSSIVTVRGTGFPRVNCK